MSVLIKGMEMPTRCEDCFCYRHNAEYDYAYCNISSVNVRGHGNARLVSCPLIPVPPHGRLIDADALHFVKGFEEDDPHDYIRRYAIEKAPTIITAEEGE